MMEAEPEGGRIGQRLRLAMKVRGDTVASLARQLEMPYRTLQDQCNGKAKPSADHLAKLQKAGFSLEYLLSGSVVWGNSLRRTISVDSPPYIAAFLSDLSAKRAIKDKISELFHHHMNNDQDLFPRTDAWSFLNFAQTFVDEAYIAVAEYMIETAASIGEFIDLGYRPERIIELAFRLPKPNLLARIVERTQAAINAERGTDGRVE